MVVFASLPRMSDSMFSTRSCPSLTDHAPGTKDVEIDETTRARPTHAQRMVVNATAAIAIERLEQDLLFGGRQRLVHEPRCGTLHQRVAGSTMFAATVAQPRDPAIATR